MAVPTRHPRLVRRGAVYYFRVAIPTDLRAHYGKAEIISSLRTKDPHEAVRLVRSRSEAQEQEFDRIRAGRTITSLTPELIEELTGRWVAEELHGDEQDRVDGVMLDKHVLPEDVANLQHLEAGMRAALARGDTSMVHATADHLLHGVGISLSRDSKDYRALAYRVLQAGVDLIQRLSARNRGDIVPTPPVAPIGNGSRTRGVTLRDLLERWTREREPTPRSRQEWELAVRRFEQLHGKMSIRDIAKHHVVAVKDRLLTDGRSTATVKKALAALASLLQMAVDDELLNTNVARGVRARGSKVRQETRLPYDAHDLHIIFSGPVHAHGERPQGGAGAASFWLPWLGLLTGARLEELGQLRLEDIGYDNNHEVYYLEISDRGEGTSVKTASSRRRVPLHDHLLEIGFIEYVDKIRHAGHDRLFPDLRRSGHGRWTPAWSQWWGRYCRRVLKINDKRKVFHSFRHSFKDACRASGIPEEAHDALTGHTGRGGVGRAYGAGQFPFGALVEAIKKLRYEGLVLPAPAVEQAVTHLVAV